MILSGDSIRQVKPLRPMHERTVIYGMTYGLGPAGYDVRVAERHVLVPGSFALGSTVERFEMPIDLVGLVKDKSTWARRGIAVQNTVIEPGWCGFLTLELTNHGPDEVVIPAGSPIAQILFITTDFPTTGYSGKYQDQPAGPQPAILERSNG